MTCGQATVTEKDRSQGAQRIFVIYVLADNNFPNHICGQQFTSF
jgi:hypothetical protein